MPIFSEGTYIFYHIEFIEDTCRRDWESSSQQVALGTDSTKTWPYKTITSHFKVLNTKQKENDI
jgi:hypothetical protein